MSLNERKAMRDLLNPMVNPDLHRKDCGQWGPCDCDAHKLSLFGKILRLLRNP